MKPTTTSFAANRPSLSDVARVFASVAGSTWGSGSITVARLREEWVVRRAKLGENEFELAYAVARIAPGTNVLAFCAAMGWRLRGWYGALIAVGALSIPAAIISTFLTLTFQRWPRPFAGAMAAVVGVILAGGYSLLQPYVRRASWWRTTAIFVVAVVLSQFLSPLLVLIISGIIGLFWPEP